MQTTRGISASMASWIPPAASGGLFVEAKYQQVSPQLSTTPLRVCFHAKHHNLPEHASVDAVKTRSCVLRVD